MRVSLFDNYGALNSPPVFDAIKTGLNTIGVECASMDSTADVAVIWSLLWHGRMKANQAVWQMFRSTNRPVIVAEVGMLRRGITWKLGINGTTNNAEYGDVIDSNRAKQLRLELKPWQDNGYNIIVACQRTDSEQWVGQPPMELWLNDTVRTLRKYTDKPIIIRPHPRQRITEIPGAVIESPQPIPGSYDGFDFERHLKTAWAVINHNSGPGSQAVISGVPAFVHTSSLAAPVANLELSQIENPARPDRETWLNSVAHTEWTIDEIASGYPLSRLLSTIPS